MKALTLYLNNSPYFNNELFDIILSIFNDCRKLQTFQINGIDLSNKDSIELAEKLFVSIS